jgi:5'-deoxynucleotidase YfbR-like HD superfamily hydrolase
MQEKLATKNFERLNGYESTYRRGAHLAQASLDLGKSAMYFSRIERIPRYADGERETDTEHSFMLALVAPELAAALEYPLDIGLVSQFATVHDLIELKTDDVATFLFTDSQQHQKEITEHQALGELLNELPPHTAHLVGRYESQTEPEARFVRYVDKLLPIVVDIIGAGVRVMREDYQVDSLALLHDCHTKLRERLLRTFGEEFPELTLAHELLCELFENTFEDRL